MVEHNRAFRNNSAEIFAEAVERIQAGETLEVVLASYPPEYRSNLDSLLAVVVKAQEIQQIPVPLPAPSRRVAHKQAFMQAVAEKRAEQALIEAARPTPVVLTEKRRSFWAAFLETFTLRPMRLAPVALMLTILLLGSTTVVTLAQESVPGDRAYPIKQWIRQQELYLSPPEQRAIVRQEQEEELVKDLKKASTRPDLRTAAIESEGVMLFHGYGADYLNIGGLRVLPRYEPNPNEPEMLPMEIVGELEPGKTVSLRYRVLPGQATSDVPIAQGIYLEVLEEQPVEPTPLPTVTPTIPSNCKVDAVSGWAPYNVQPGDSLADLAHRTGSSLEELRLQNCLATEEVIVGEVLLLPPGISQPTRQASPVSTVVSTPTDTATPVAVVTDTVNSLPTATSSMTATVPVALPPTATPEERATPTLVFTATIILPPSVTAWITVTPTAGPPITTTVAATPTSTVETDDPTAPATTWPTVTPTVEKPMTSTQESTLTATVSPETPAPPATAVMTTTAIPVDTAAPGETEETETATPAASPVVSSTPTSEATPSATSDMTETPTAQATGLATADATPSVIAPVTPDTVTPDVSPTASATPEPTVAEATSTATSVSPPAATNAPPPTATDAQPPPAATNASPPTATDAPPPSPTSGPPPEKSDTKDSSAPVESADVTEKSP